MLPTNKLVTDLVASEAVYINTGHPDFISGHKAMALVNAKIEAAKPAPGPQTVDPKSGKIPNAALNNGRDLDVDARRDQEQGFFGSFFKGQPGGPKKKGLQAMEAPPPNLRASGTLSERETMETDVIKRPSSSSSFSCRKKWLMADVVHDSVDQLVLQHCQADGHRHGPKGHHAQARRLFKGRPPARAPLRSVPAFFSRSIAGRH